MRKRKIFYKIYFTGIVLFFAGMIWVLVWLHGWLKTYEASQPEAKCNQVFEELFVSPDWGRIYDLSKTEDTVFEGREAYASYMTEKVGTDSLTLTETSAGLSGNKKYFVKLGEEKLLSFTLLKSEGEKGITEWNLGDITLLFAQSKGVQILKKQGHTVFVNDVALDDSYTVERIETLAEEYLPEDLNGQCLELQCVEGLLVQPEISVTDESGESCEVEYDPETNTYTEKAAEDIMEEKEKKEVLAIAEGYCKFMIGADGNLASFFKKGTEIYATIRGNDSWMQDYRGYTFEEESVTGYYRYSPSLFSARVSLSLQVTRKNGTIKEYALDASFFFEKQEDGTYRAVEMTNVDVNKQVKEVRITFCAGEEVLQTGFVKSDAKKLTLPAVSVPEGRTFLGWGKEEEDETGKKRKILMFVPDEAGEVSLPEGYVLEPLTLFPLFE